MPPAEFPFQFAPAYSPDLNKPKHGVGQVQEYKNVEEWESRRHKPRCYSCGCGGGPKPLGIGKGTSPWNLMEGKSLLTTAVPPRTQAAIGADHNGIDVTCSMREIHQDSSHAKVLIAPKTLNIRPTGVLDSLLCTIANVITQCTNNHNSTPNNTNQR